MLRCVIIARRRIERRTRVKMTDKLLSTWNPFEFPTVNIFVAASLDVLCGESQSITAREHERARAMESGENKSPLFYLSSLPVVIAVIAVTAYAMCPLCIVFLFTRVALRGIAKPPRIVNVRSSHSRKPGLLCNTRRRVYLSRACERIFLKEKARAIFYLRKNADESLGRAYIRRVSRA